MMSNISYTFDPGLLRRFTISSSFVFINSMAKFVASPLFSETPRSWLVLFLSGTFENARGGFFFPWTGAMNKIYMKKQCHGVHE